MAGSLCPWSGYMAMEPVRCSARTQQKGLLCPTRLEIPATTRRCRSAGTDQTYYPSQSDGRPRVQGRCMYANLGSWGLQTGTADGRVAGVARG